MKILSITMLMITIISLCIALDVDVDSKTDFIDDINIYDNSTTYTME